MPNLIDQNGLTIASIDEIMSTLTLGAIEFPGYLAIVPGANGRWPIEANVAINLASLFRMGVL